MNQRFAKGEKIEFDNEIGNPYTVRAIGERYAVLTRPACESDYGEDGFDISEGTLVYTILDSETWTRAPHNMVLNGYDFATDEGCEDCLRDLQDGKIKLSRRWACRAVLSEAGA